MSHPWPGTISFEESTAITETADSIAVSPNSVILSDIDETVTLTATVFDTTGNVITNAPLLWTVANSDIATVDQSGTVTAVSDGTTRIAITAGTVSVKIPILVDSGLIILESERALLVKLYEETEGRNWNQNTHWLSRRPLEAWHGVRTNADGHITELLLNDNNLEGQIPSQLGNIKNLAMLDLSGNNLSGSLPDELAELTDLVELDLSDNTLTDAILPTLGDLNKLTELYLNANRFFGPLPSELGELSALRVLSIANNTGLSGEVPVSFTSLGALNVFHANGTDVCLPTNPLLQNWNAGLTTSSVSPCEVPAAPALDISVSSLTIDEGSNNSYTVRLAKQPTANVAITITGHQNTDLTLDKTTLNFTTNNWNAAQTVTVTAGQDANEANETVDLVHTASGGNYGRVEGNIVVTINDDDAVKLNLSVSSLTIDEGSNNSYTVSLAKQPTANVAVTITGYQNTDLTLDKTTLTFTTANWNAAQTVTVTAGQDNDSTDDAATLVHTASGGNYENVTGSVAVTVNDDDAVKLNLSVPSLTIDEGSNNSYTVRLAKQPTANVTVTITGYQNTDLTLDKTTLTFTTANWNAAQTVTVTAGQDNDSTDDAATLVHTASGGNYGNVKENVTVTITDNDAAALNLSVSSLTIDEGSDLSYTVKLATQPTANVTVTITGYQNTDLTLNKTTLTFTTTNWNAAQTVTVSASQDDDSSDDTATLVHTAFGSNYGSVTGNVVVTVTDDDTPELDLSVSSLTIDEGSNKNYTIKLSTQPAANAVVTITGYQNTDLTLNKTTLTFTDTNWNTAQTVTVSAGQDNDSSDDKVTLIHTASGSNYGSVTENVAVTVRDADAPNLDISVSSLAIDEGSSNSYTVKLATQPTANITVTITGYQNTDLTLDKTTLTFTTTNWNAAQVVPVTARQDNDSSDDTVTLVHTASGGNYGSVEGNIVVTINDDDTVKLNLSVSSLTIDEGGSRSYTVRLTTRPVANVTVAITGDQNTDLRLVKPSLTFTTINWNIPQTVRVLAGRDDDWNDDTATLVHTASGGNYGGVTADIPVTVIDDAKGKFLFSSPKLEITEGASKNYTVQLATQPTADVTVTITGYQNTDLTLSKTFLTFTTTNWNAFQIVIVDAGKDSDWINDTATLVHTADANYGNLTANIPVTVIDPDRGELVISRPTLTIDEGSSDQNYTVRPATKPVANTTVTITGYQNTDLTLNKTTLNFTTTNWNIPQTVSVSADQDDDSADDTATLVHTADANYGGVVELVRVTIKDSDKKEFVLSDSKLEIDEGSTMNYTVHLITQPTANITMSITGYQNTDLTLNKATLNFTTTNWNSPQTVTVSAGQDNDWSDDTETLTHTGLDANYRNVTENIAITVIDDDKPGLDLSVSSLTIDEGSSMDYTVRLAARPTGNVTVAIILPGSPDVALNKLALNFTTTDWNVPQTVTITAEQDEDSKDDTGTLLHTGLGANYGGVTGNVALMVIDDDTPSLDISVSNLTIDEGNSKSYTVQLPTKPESEVRVNITSSEAHSHLTLSNTVLRFTVNNRFAPQTVTVTANQDTDWNNNFERLTHTAAGAGYGGVSTDVTVTMEDDDSPPSPPHAYVFQSVQSFSNPVPIIAGEAALLRVFPTANTTTTTTIPRAVATFYLNNAVEHTINIAAKNSPIPTEVFPENLQLSLNADIPASVIQTGLEMVVEIDPDNVVPGNLGVEKRMPASGRISLNIVSVPTFEITFIPFVTTGDGRGNAVVSIAQQLAANPDTDSYLHDLRTLLPVKDISATAHATVTVTSRNIYSLVLRVDALRAMENGTGHWMGLHNNPSGGNGIAKMNGATTVAQPDSRVIAHELAHNLGLLHAPCGTLSGLDGNYPYTGGVTGTWGYESGSIHDPDRYRDLMSYCKPFWISDYHFKKAADRRTSKFSPNLEPTLASKPPEKALLLWGGTDAASRPHLEPVFEIEATPTLPESPGPWQLAGHAENGDELFRLTFAMPVTADGDGSSPFAFVVPLQQSHLLNSVTLSGPGGSFTINEEHNDPMAIVIDQASGQVTGFLDNYDPTDNSLISDISNKMGGTEQRVLFSRGIPDLRTQN